MLGIIGGGVKPMLVDQWKGPNTNVCGVAERWEVDGTIILGIGETAKEECDNDSKHHR